MSVIIQMVAVSKTVATLTEAMCVPVLQTMFWTMMAEVAKVNYAPLK